MGERKQFKLPDVGEGLVEADIVKWHVRPGDTVEVNQTIVEIETAKAMVELPCPFEGTVTDLLVEEGTTVDVGTPIIAVDVGGDGPAEEEGKREPVLVGYGAKQGPTKRRPRRPRPGTGPAPGRSAATSTPANEPEGTASPAEQQPGYPQDAAGLPAERPSAGQLTSGGRPQEEGVAANAAVPWEARVAVLAKPPVRKLAKDLGVDLTTIQGSGPQGSITRDDIRAAAARQDAGAAVRPAGGGREERIPIRGVRKHTAAAMVRSAFTAPHVSEWLQVDVTETMSTVRRLRELPDFAGVKVSPLLLAARALLLAVRRYPMINSAWDEEAQEIVVKRYVNLGIAAATERGLIVPNVKDAHDLSLPELARALAELTETARAGRSSPQDLSGGTITITNVGVFGVDAGTPILTPGESAILAFGQIRDMPWVHDGQLAIRKVTTLALSFDHRIVDGELGSYVLRDVGAMLEDPVRMLAWS